MTEKPTPAAPTPGPQSPPSNAGHITRGQLQTMTPEEIERARVAGLLDHLLNPDGRR